MAGVERPLARVTDIRSPVFYMLKPDADEPLLQESEMA
ncbi:hypothetical protein FOTG_17481 [Fusarium oxysporum f. sp. vasinfectum 25433]|uniref:Uncharacterized protein n=1 Tax=Fusarium oxysporum f. sp. vasinfectum 25433 TaxID=1089449 RepID=X0KZ65_FUSOX|nr:hypothetical protein FOTG_17481 [Fusarium oxysporum f. sp. vasinfectum 25433]